MTALLIAAGGALGAVLRYLIDHAVQRRSDGGFPYGTLTVNVLGSALLGLLAGLTLDGASGDAVRSLVGIGLCGSLTTYSTFGYETVRLLTDGARRQAVVNVVGTILAGFAAAGAGLLLAAAF
ncbi:fluoride efflux transporter CrcB [Haloechinothrix salitolerans]|uniref:Fluoride-specific ion channel FluC n=1 Tax=Haloechinothrix salitolerans TaxID=926830 RepID=A0ABW2C2T6_9PSEU